MELAPIDWDDKPGLIASARRYKRLLVGLLVIGALAGLALSLLQPTLYQAEARLLIDVPPSGSGVEPNRYLLDQTELITSVTVTDRAAKLAGGRVSGKTLRDRLTTSTTIDRDLITVKVMDPSAPGAVRLVDAVGRAYTEIVAEQARTSADGLETVQARLRTSITDTEAKLLAKPADPVLRAERDALVGQLGVITARRQELTSGASQSGVRLREVLPAPSSPAQPKALRNLAAGALLGLLVALGLTWWLGGRSETRIMSSDEVERLLGLPLMARLPAPNRKDARTRPVMLDDPETVEAEAFRFLRASFASSLRQNGAKVVMVTSATEQEGKSVVTANLALALARAGQRVALVDMDLRRPVQQRLLELPESSGFTEVALGKVRLERALHRLVLVDPERGRDSSNRPRREAGFIEVLAAGSRPKGVGELIGNRSTEEIIKGLRERVDVVLIDAPPMLRVGDGLILASSVDAVLVVSRLNVARRKSLQELRRLLDSIGTKLLGVVVTGTPATDTYTRPYGVPTRQSVVVTRAGGQNGNGRPVAPVPATVGAPQAKPAAQAPAATGKPATNGNGHGNGKPGGPAAPGSGPGQPPKPAK